MNQQIRNVVTEIIMQRAEATPEAKELIEKRNEAIEALYVLKRDGLICDEVVDVLENSIWQYGSICAETFFSWGLKIGADPAIALDMPGRD